MYYQPPSTTVNYFTIPGIVKNEYESEVLDHIIDETAIAFGINREDLFRKCRFAHVKYARWAIWKIMRSRGNTYKECGEALGDHDHTTVINALSKFDADMEKVYFLRRAWRQIKKYMMYTLPLIEE